MEKLQKGEPDWHQKINDNFEEINEKVVISESPPPNMKEGAIWYKPLKDLSEIFSGKEVISFGNLGEGLDSEEKYKLIGGEKNEINQ